MRCYVFDVDYESILYVVCVIVKPCKLVLEAHMLTEA